ncbi:MAG: hypothetical protein AB8B69_20150 [Chitinophagales bacterium]
MKATTQNNTKITLSDQNEIHRGGEGRILLIPELPRQVAKIYHNPQNAITLQQIQELQVLDAQYFVKPLQLIYDSSKSQVIGFTMNYLGKDFFPLAALFSAPFCQRKQIDESHKWKIAEQIQIAISKAHQHQIVIGDLSGLNILVNEKGVVKFIDTDAYQTPTQPHSGILYDEIRDHYFHGQVSQNSDHFAFAVILFQLLAYIHPFKGIHQQYKSLAERMIHQIPVFANDPQLKTPKCFRPILQPILQQQFEAIFMNGHRAPIQLSKTNQTAQKLQKVLPKNIIVKKGSLQVNTFYQLERGETIVNVMALKNRLLLKTNRQYLIFEVQNQGYASLKHRFATQNFDEMFIGNQQILGKKQQELWVLKEDSQQFSLLQNVAFSLQSRWAQLDDLLVLVEDDYLKTIHLDEVNQSFIQVEQTPVFGQGIHTNHQGLWQLAGGKTYTFYHSGKHLSTVLVDLPVKSIQVFGNHGIVTYQEHLAGKKETTLKHEYFSLQNLQCQLSDVLLPQAKTIAYKALKGGHGLVFEAADDKMLIRRSQDFAILQELTCPLLADDTQLFHTNAGIVAATESGLCLLNNR